MKPMQVLADGVARKLDPRVIPFDRAVGWIVALTVSFCLLLALLVAWLTSTLPAWTWAGTWLLWLLITGGLAWLGHAWPPRDYEVTSYLLNDIGIEIRRGVYWRQIIAVPRSRVQHIDVRQGPLRRSYGLSTLMIFTAGTEHSSVSLPGLAHETALALRDLLLPETPHDGV